MTDAGAKARETCNRQLVALLRTRLTGRPNQGVHNPQHRLWRGWYLRPAALCTRSHLDCGMHGACLAQQLTVLLPNLVLHARVATDSVSVATHQRISQSYTH